MLELPYACCAACGAPLTSRLAPTPHPALTLPCTLTALLTSLCAEAVARQLRIRLEPGMVDMGGESLRAVGEYRLPLKLVLPSGDRATLDITLAST